MALQVRQAVIRSARLEVQSYALDAAVVGGAKARALAAFQGGIPDPKWPVTALLTHRNPTVLAEAELRSADVADVMVPQPAF